MRKSAKPRAIKNYYLRKVGTELYWDGNQYFGYNYSVYDYPQFSSTRKVVSLTTAKSGFDQIEVGRASSKPISRWPECEIVCETLQVVSVERVSYKTDPRRLLPGLLERHSKASIASAYLAGLEQKIDMKSFQYLLVRKGGKAVIEENIEGSFSQGFVSFLKDDKQVVLARLLLGEKSGELHEMKPINDLVDSILGAP